MTTLSRRGLIKVAGAAAVGAAAGVPLAASAAAEPERYEFPTSPFTLGVASGDPTPRSVILWTRLAPDPYRGNSGMGGAPEAVQVRWSITRRVPGQHAEPTRYSGVVSCLRDEGYSVHLDVEAADGGGRLEPGGEYLFRFSVPRTGGGEWTSSGFTRTAPHPEASVEANFVVMGCQSFGLNQRLHPIGQRHLSRRTAGEIDAGPLPQFGVFVGDYMYEFAARWAQGEDALALGAACTTLAGYRQRYAWYKAQPDLQDFHRNYPFFAVPDDHEWWNDMYGGTISAGRFRRFNAALQAYWENMPMRARPVDTLVDGRVNVDSKGSLELYRQVSWGRHLSLVLADVRQYRRIDGTTLLGQQQLESVLGWVQGSQASWTAVASGVPMAVFGERGIEWCEYPADREAMTQLLSERTNQVSLAGDLHCGMVNAVRRHDDYSSNFVATEFICPPASSGGNAKWGELINTGPTTDDVGTTVERATFIEGGTPQRGYLQCTVNRDEWVSEMFVGNDVSRPDGDVWSGGRFRVASGQVGAHRIG
jgi:alkaline phosphatase D